MQTKDGALKQAAAARGLSLEQYLARLDAGEKWCRGCMGWQPTDAFGRDTSRGDGLDTICKASRRLKYSERNPPRPRRRHPHGRTYVAPRPGDKKQARRRVNHLVDVGLLPDPNDLPCVDCENPEATPDRRHEYDHYLGYGVAHHEHVEAVCSECHHRREKERNGRDH